VPPDQLHAPGDACLTPLGSHTCADVLGTSTMLEHCCRFPHAEGLSWPRPLPHVLACNLGCATSVLGSDAQGVYRAQVGCAMRQAAEHLAAAGGLPVAVRYLRRAAELPPSNTSWYMGLSNGSAGLCAPRALLALYSMCWAPTAALAPGKPSARALLADPFQLPISSRPPTRPGTWSCPMALQASVCPRLLFAEHAKTPCGPAGVVLAGARTLLRPLKPPACLPRPCRVHWNPCVWM
jgi:hypothetical protein